MVLTANNFTTFIQALGLSQVMHKPSPLSYSNHPSVTKMAISSVNAQASDYPSYDDANQQGKAASTSLPLNGFLASSSQCSVQHYEPLELSNQAFPPFDASKATVYRYRQQQSVNLGSWFVHEAWMTPSLFACAAGDKISELDIASGWGSPDLARAVLERHWDSFITASDFQYLASIGINTVRLPIGYWSLGPDYCQGTPFEPVASVYQNAWPRVVRTINMAADEGIGVLVDLHGAPGSQNGQQHSGISDGQVNLFGNDWYVNKTMAVLTFLIQELVNVTNVVGIQILNEPKNVSELADFYTTAISTMRQVNKEAESFPLYIHDGFDLFRFSNYVADRSDFVVQDHHSYFVFTPNDQSEPAAQHTKDIHDSITDDLATASDRQRRNLVVDEFSCALTDQSLANEQNPDQARREFCEGQMDIYQNKTAGWAFWAYITEDGYNDPGWCFKAAVGRSLPPTFFAYGKGPFANTTSIPALADMVAEMGTPASSGLMTASPSSPSDAAPSSTLEAGVYPNPIRRRSRLRPDRRSKTAQTSRKSERRRDDTSQLPLDPSERAISKGYSDGFSTAKIFALYGMSKLGFTGQYIHDSVAKLGQQIIDHETEHFYRQWFMQGLSDGEALIKSYVDQTQM